MTDHADILRRLEAAKGADNTLDIDIELALFQPDADYKSARANAAYTKVIYTRRDGTEVTHWAPDHTLSADRRKTFLALFRSIGEDNG
jgi:hypothetical protein